MSPFARYAEHLLKGGYSPVPLRADTGQPVVKWTPLRTAVMTPDEIRRLVGRWPNLGLAVAGGFNGLVPIDLDTDDTAVMNAMLFALPYPTVVRRGSKGFVGFFRDPTGTIGGRTFAPPNAKPLLEVKGSGLVTIPPTRHRETGHAYEWWNIETLFNTRVDELPEITPQDIARLEKALSPWCPPKPVFVPQTIEGARPTSGKRIEASARTALQKEVKYLASLRSGRGNALFIAICRLGRFVHHKVLTRAEVENALIEASKVNGYVAKRGLRACEDTIGSGLHKSARDPLPILKDRPRNRAT